MEYSIDAKYNKVLANFPVEAHGPSLIMYAISLEAWRRGIEVKFFTTYVKGQLKIRYLLVYQGKSHRFQLSLGDKVSKEARRIGRSKDLTKKYLLAAGVPVPEGKVISVQMENFNEAVSYAELLGYPVIVKPAYASLAIGVYTNIKNQQELISALKSVHTELGHNDIMIERHASGVDTRTYVLGNRVIGSFKRVPANVTGDNQHKIKELIEIKNEYRKRNPHLSKDLIKIDEDIIHFLKGQGYDLDSIPGEGKRIYLSDSTFAKDCSETVDITDEVTEKFKHTAVEAVKNLPGMQLAGVDIMMNQELDQNYVLEVNCRPNIGGHLFPVIGQSRDIPAEIIDYYFPETMGINIEKAEYFTFDFDSIISFLRTGIVKEMTLPSLPKKDVVNKAILLSGDVESHKKQICKAALGHRLGGSINEETDETAHVIIAGKERDVENFMEKLLNLSDKINVQIIEKNTWDSLIMYRFQLPNKTQSYFDTNLNEEAMSETKALKHENEKLKKIIEKMENSNSWKITKPLRVIGKIGKKTQS